MKLILPALASAFLLASAAPVAFADESAATFKIDRAEAVEIAAQEGLTRVLETDRDDGKWELEGCTADKREIEVDIHGQTGEVLKVDTDSDYEDDCQ